MISESSGSGIFSGLLPPIGYPGTFNVSFPYEVDIDFSYPELANNMALEFGGGGGGTVAETPEPGTLVLLASSGLAVLLYVWRKRRAAG